MQKVLAITFLLLFSFTIATEARVQYDSDNKIIEDDTIRGRRRAVEAQIESQRKIDAMAAAKIDYEQELKKLEKPESKLKSNYYKKSQQ